MAMVFRKIPFAQMNMTNVIISYYIEVVNVTVTVVSLPLIYVLIIHPLPLFIAQFCAVAAYCCGSLIVALGSAVSLFQILYVVQFNILFTLDPATVGWRTFFGTGQSGYLHHDHGGNLHDTEGNSCQHNCVRIDTNSI